MGYEAVRRRKVSLIRYIFVRKIRYVVFLFLRFRSMAAQGALTASLGGWAWGARMGTDSIWNVLGAIVEKERRLGQLLLVRQIGYMTYLSSLRLQRRSRSRPVSIRPPG